MNVSFYSQEELLDLGFKSVGKDCLISRKASFYGIGQISIGDYVRIDDFCILSGKVTLGSFIHIAAYCALYGAYGIRMEDYTGMSARSTVYSAMDDFSGDYLVGPMCPEGTTKVTGGEVVFRRFSQVGAHCLVFPAVEIGEGAVVGACSMVRESLQPWGVYYGIPATWKKERSRAMLKWVEK